MPQTSWPPLPLDQWRDTCDTLHLWTQVAGKICLALAPPANHFWNTTFRVVPRGLRTPTLFCRGVAFEMMFDLVGHQFLVQAAEEPPWRVDLRPQSVAVFYGAVKKVLRAAGLDVSIWPVPVEVPDPIPFERDLLHASYDPAFAGRFLQVLLDASRVLETFRAGFLGKASPVHLFWGSFDLAVTRFSGRPAPPRPGADAATREAYSHEVISHGFWPGGGGFPDAAFYAYAAPVPTGLDEARVAPAEAFYHREMGEFILPYETVRRSADPERALMDFLRSTYAAAADLAGWDRLGLERHVPEAR
jgi:hypothetical protein